MRLVKSSFSTCIKRLAGDRKTRNFRKFRGGGLEAEVRHRVIIRREANQVSGKTRRENFSGKNIRRGLVSLNLRKRRRRDGLLKLDADCYLFQRVTNLLVLLSANLLLRMAFLLSSNLVSFKTRNFVFLFI